MTKKRKKLWRRVKAYYRKLPHKRRRILVRGYKFRLGRKLRRRLPVRPARAGRYALTLRKRKKAHAKRRVVSRKVVKRKLPTARRKVLKPKPKPKVLPPWLPVPEYVHLLEREIKSKIIVVDPIQRINTKPSSAHWVRLSDKLCWESRKAPSFRRGIVVIAVWILVYDEKDDEHKILSRSRSYGLRQQFYESQKRDRRQRRMLVDSPDSERELLELRDDLYAMFSEWAKRRDYVEERGMVAWSFWFPLTYAPRKEGDNPNPPKG